MDDQRTCDAKVGNVAEEFQAFDQFDTGVIAAFDGNGEQAAGTFGTDFGDTVL